MQMTRKGALFGALIAAALFPKVHTLQFAFALLLTLSLLLVLLTAGLYLKNKFARRSGLSWQLLRSLLPFLTCVIMACSTTALSERTAPSSGNSDAAEQPNLSRFFQGVEGAFVLLDPQTGRTVRHNPELARTRFLPASTYKIPNTLIALETGVVSGPDFPLAWNSTVAPRQPWWPVVWAEDHTLRTALVNSVVWYYQELARRIGAEGMKEYVNRFGYGNRDISGGIDQFWLTGGLRISAEEQVDFLRRFYFGKLNVSERSTRIAKDLLVLEETPNYRLSGKTGWAGLGETSAPQIGWLVGYLERAGKVYFFATNVDIEKKEDAAARLSITKAILRDLGLIED